jgi:hypothetical protein
MELAPCHAFGGTGCQGVIGPFPYAFLDKRFEKNWTKDKPRFEKGKINFIIPLMLSLNLWSKKRRMPAAQKKQ